MRVVIFGASGGVGKHLVQLAVDQGHTVTTVTRLRIEHPSVKSVVDDVLRPGCFDDHVGGHDVVLSSLGLKRSNPANPWSALVSPADFCSRTAAALVAAMKKHGVPRVIAVSAAGVAESAPRMNLLMKFMVATSNVGAGYRDLAIMERIYAESGLEWSCPRPVRLTDGPLSNKVRVIEGFPMNAAISRVDVAAFMLGQVQGPIGDRLASITGN